MLTHRVCRTLSVTTVLSLTGSIALASSGQSGLVVLSQSASGALTMNGNSSVEIPARVVYVNSTSETAVLTNGRAVLNTTAMYVVGKTHFNGQSHCTGSVFHGAPPFYDPFRAMPMPSTSGMNSFDAIDIKSSDQTIVLQPGHYPQGLKITGNASVQFAPGVFVIGGPGLIITSGHVTGAGVCLIILSGESRLTGASTLSLSPIDTGPTAGMVLIQPASNTNPVRLAGGGSFSIAGTIYAPGAEVNLVGNSTVEGVGPLMGDLVIGDTVSLSGTATIRIGRAGMQRVTMPSLPLFD